MSHNKERRIKRDEKLDKKSQAMEELKAEREKRKNRTGTVTCMCKLGINCTHLLFVLLSYFQNIFCSI